RSLADPEEIAYYACYGPRRSSTADLAWIAGSRWHIEECFQQAKNEAGLDQYQVRAWRAWYAHITLSMLALAWLAASKAQAEKRGSAPATRAWSATRCRRSAACWSAWSRPARPTPRMCGAGPAGAGDVSTRPGCATTSDAAMRSPKCRCSIRRPAESGQCSIQGHLGGGTRSALWH